MTLFLSSYQIFIHKFLHLFTCKEDFPLLFNFSVISTQKKTYNALVIGNKAVQGSLTVSVTLQLAFLNQEP